MDSGGSNSGLHGVQGQPLFTNHGLVTASPRSVKIHMEKESQCSENEKTTKHLSLMLEVLSPAPPFLGCVCVCMCVWCLLRPEETFETLGLELQKVGSLHVGVKKSKCS